MTPKLQTTTSKMTNKWYCVCDLAEYNNSVCQNIRSVCNHQNMVRYALGNYEPNISKKTLICFGVNPSTAFAGCLDDTLTRVRNYAIDNCYDSWIMLNLYPQRATNPTDIHNSKSSIIFHENIKFIEDLLTKQLKQEFDIWLAWGDNVDSRDFLKEAKREIKAIIGKLKPTTNILAKGLTKSNNPLHPISTSVTWKSNGKYDEIPILTKIEIDKIF